MGVAMLGVWCYWMVIVVPLLSTRVHSRAKISHLTSYPQLESHSLKKESVGVVDGLLKTLKC